MYVFSLSHLFIVFITNEYTLMILSYNEQQVFNQKIASFLNVFFNGLEKDMEDFVLKTPIGMFPVLEKSFEFDNFTYLVLDPEKEVGIQEITFAHNTAIFLTEQEIICIEKLKGKDHYYGFRMTPTRTVGSDWLKALQVLVTYALETLKGRARNTLITYQSSGYKIVPVSPTILEDKYNLMFERAKLLLA